MVANYADEKRRFDSCPTQTLVTNKFFVILILEADREAQLEFTEDVWQFEQNQIKRQNDEFRELPPSRLADVERARPASQNNEKERD